MTHEDQIVEAFKRNNWRMELGHILQYPWGYEFRARATELRHKGYVIQLWRARKPATASSNLYIMIPPEENGQMRIAI